MSRPTISEVELRLMQERIVARRNGTVLEVPIKKVEPYNKYRNKKVVIDGITFDSKKEAYRYGILKLNQAAGLIRNLKLQVSFPITINNVHICDYRADFTYDKPVLDGESQFVAEDVKGIKTPEYKLKKKLMLAVYQIQIKES